MTRVAIAGTSDVARAGIASLVSGIDAFALVGRASTPDDLRNLTRASAPDVVLIDVDPGDADELPHWLAALGDAGDAIDSPGVVLLSDDPAAEAYGRHRAWASLPRRAGREEIEASIRAVATGLVVVHPDALDQPAPVRSPADGGVLTPRELEVLGMLAAGLPNKAIARKLGVSAHTVKFHVGSIMTKLHASSRTEAVTDGIRRGLIFL